MIRTLHLIPVWTRPRLTLVPSEVFVWQKSGSAKTLWWSPNNLIAQFNTVRLCNGGEICHEIHLTDDERRSNACVCLLLTDERNPAGRKSESLQPLMSELLFWSAESNELNNRRAF